MVRCERCSRFFFSTNRFKKLKYGKREFLVCPICIKEKEKDERLNNLEQSKPQLKKEIYEEPRNKIFKDKEVQKYENYASYSSSLGAISICIWFFGNSFLTPIIWLISGFLTSILSFYCWRKARKHGIKRLLSTIFSIFSLILSILVLLSMITYIYISSIL